MAQVKERGGSSFISRAAKKLTANSVPQSFLASKPNGNACYAGYHLGSVRLTLFWNRNTWDNQDSVRSITFYHIPGTSRNDCISSSVFFTSIVWLNYIFRFPFSEYFCTLLKTDSWQSFFEVLTFSLPLSRLFLPTVPWVAWRSLGESKEQFQFSPVSVFHMNRRSELFHRYIMNQNTEYVRELPWQLWRIM